MRSTSAIVLLATPLLLAAQQGTVRSRALNRKCLSPTAAGRHEDLSHDRSDAFTLWSEDFEDGLDGWTTETPYGGVSWELTSTGNTNGYTPEPLRGTSAYPGGQWIQADSDAHGTAGAPENTMITSPPLLGFGEVHFMLLRFEQSFRQLNDDQTLVKVSGDGGANWVTYPVNQDLPGNQMTPGAPQAQVITLNISSALVPVSDDIRIRFEWISDEGYTYSWQVDEISLLSVPANDVTMIGLEGKEHVVGTGYYGPPCTSYPVGEVRTMDYKAVVGNNGSTTQTNVRLQAEVTGPDGYATIYTSPGIALAPATVDSLFLEDLQPPDVIGDYTYVFSVVQDEEDAEPENNARELSLRVDAEVFARDDGQVDNSRDNGGAGYELGNRFWIQGYGRTLEGVDVALGPGTEAGALITAIVYDGSNDYVGSSDLYIVQASDINEYGGTTFIHLPLLEPAALESERLYLACVSVQTENGNVFTGTSGISAPQTSLIRPSGSGTWYYTTSTPMVRMRLADDTGVSSLTPVALDIRAWPSPFDDQVTISFHSGQSGTTQWELRDASARIVRSGYLGHLPAGERRITLDGAALDRGVYTMWIGTGGQRSAIKLVREAHP